MPTQSLSDHDRRFHPGGYKPGDPCILRNNDLKNEMRMAAELSAPQPDESVVRDAEGIVGKMEAMAREWHGKQSKPRKGKEKLPYIVHPEAVVKMLKGWGFTEEDNPVTLGVAWGHDLLEETKMTVSDMMRLLKGEPHADEIACGIVNLSMNPALRFRTSTEYNEYKRDYIENIARTAPPEVLAVKIADRLANTLDFCAAGNPWGREYLRQGNPLFRRIDEIPHSDKIRKTLDDTRNLVKKLQVYNESAWLKSLAAKGEDK